MKKVVVAFSLLVSAISFAQSGCCNVVDGAGLTVVDSNGLCITAPNLPSYSGDCASTVSSVSTNPKHELVKLKKAEAAILTSALEGVKFKTDSDNLLPESLPKIDAVADLMKSNPNYNLMIDGYTDNTGKSDYNHDLSYRRAEAVKARLMTDGIKGSRITTHGYGEENPVATNDTAAGRAKNRRVEFILTY